MEEPRVELVRRRTSSTPSAKFVCARAQRSDTASSRSTNSLYEKSKSDTTLGETTVASKSNLKFDSGAQSVRRPTATPEGSTFPSSRGCSLPSQFGILIPDASSEFDELECSNNLIPVLQTGMRMSSRTPSGTMDQYRGQPIPYKVSRNMGSTSPYASSTKNSMDGRLPPVELTDKKFTYEFHGRRPIPSNYSCVNKIAGRQVPFPRSNRTSMCVGGPVGRYGNTARRILHRPWIGTDQSASSISSQAATIHSCQSRPCLQTAIDQSEASNPGSFCYKSRCRSQFVSSVVSNSTAASRNTLSSIGYRRYFSNRTLQFDISPRVNYLSNKPVRCLAPGIDCRSNTPVRWKPTVEANYMSNSPVRCQEARPSQLSNTPVRYQPSSPNSTSMYLLWCLWSTYRMRRRQTKRRRLRKSNLMYALYVATRLWHLPLIGNICYRFIGWMWSGLLWYTTTTSTRASESNSANN